MSTIKGKIMPIVLMWLAVLALVFVAKYFPNQPLNIELGNLTNNMLIGVGTILGAIIGGVWSVLSKFDDKGIVINAIVFICGAAYGALLGFLVGLVGTFFLAIVAQTSLLLIIGTAIFTATYLIGIYIKSKKIKHK
jgi:hypothetical protein